MSILRSLQSCPPLDECINEHDGWNELDHVVLSQNLFFYDTDPNVKEAREIRQGSLLNGGIMIRKGKASAKGPWKKWISEQMEHVVVECERQLHANGFVGCSWIPHPHFPGQPVVIDVTQVSVLYHLSPFSIPQCKYYQRGFDGKMYEITNVQTFYRDPPDANGNIRSLISRVRSDYVHELALSTLELMAAKNRALPVMITTQQLEKHDSNTLTSPMTRSANEAAKQTDTAGKDASVQNITSYEPVMNRMAAFYDKMRPSTFSMDEADHLQHLICAPYFSGHTKLESGRLFVPAPLPEGPGDLHLKFRAVRRERIFTLMGVPIAMVTRETSTGANKIKDGAQNPHTFIIFENAQQALKHEMLGILYNLFYAIHTPAMLSVYLEETPEDKWNAQDAIAATEVVIEIPSIPDEDRLNQYYTMGFLKYDAIVKYIGSKHGIPEECFNEEPEITVPEANGIMPETDGPPKKKKK